MKFIVTRDYEELSQVMAQLMLKHMHTEKERTNIAITTGSTCIPVSYTHLDVYKRQAYMIKRLIHSLL